jgi:hypothetical protein
MLVLQVLGAMKKELNNMTIPHEYIDKDELLFEMTNAFIPQDMDTCRAHALAKKLIANAPAADVVPVKHGRWLDMDVLDAHYQPVYKCSECGKEVADYYIDNHKYCLHCGAKMDGGNK